MGALRITVLQVAYGDDEPVAARRDRVAAWVAAQTDADLVVLPELWAPGGFDHHHWRERAEEVDGPTVRAIADAARAAGAVVHAGSIIERGGSGEDAGAEPPLWNTSVVLGVDGAVLATYRKVHRFGFGVGEPVLLQPGEDVVTAALPLGDGGAGSAEGDRCVVTGLATCYDLRFPELFRTLVDDGAELVLVPAAWPAARVEHWSLLARARALEDQVVLVAANTAGTHARHTMGGASAVVGARGQVLAEAGDGEQALTVEVDLGDVARWRAEFPVLADRRLR